MNNNKSSNENDVVHSKDKYGLLVEEAYIKPIRAVVVVDDEFPNLDQIIDEQLKEINLTSEQVDFSPKKYIKVDLERVKNLLKYSRSKDREWLVDIYDGSKIKINDEYKLPSHLQHSDLMILDYHLNGDAGTGDNAIEIIRMLASSNHFNMIAVYTKGDGGQLDDVFSEIALSLCKYPSGLELTTQNGVVLQNTLDDFVDGFEEDLIDTIGTKGLLAYINSDLDINEFLKSGYWLDVEIKVVEKIGRFPKLLLAKYLLNKIADQKKSNFSEISYGTVKHAWESGFNWIRVDTLFLTVVGKNCSPDTIPDKLLNALIEWRPTPHQLIMSKMRAQMDEYGVHAESGVLRDRILQAGWLAEFFKENLQDQALNWRGNMSHHWSALGDRVRMQMKDYSGKISEYLNEITKEGILSRFHMNEFQDDQIFRRMNSFNSFKLDVDDAHLTTGHVFKAEDGEFWVCLSPACDLVPGQKKNGRFKQMSDKMPFIAVKLYQISNELALKDANSNIHIFMDEWVSEKCYSFHPNGELSATPHWEMMYASRGGRFDDKKIVATVVAFGDSGPEVSEKVMSVLAQLRYEYAINLLHKLGVSLSRVGLDYRSTVSN